jgi:uncharacterized membrane protein (UPF0127 family)
VYKTTLVATVTSVAAAIVIVAIIALYIYPAFNGFEGLAKVNLQQTFNLGESPPKSIDTSNYKQVNVTINNIDLVADVAANDEQRTKGLSVKDSLAENKAMLFVFDSSQEHSFWMKDMKFPIDIIWLDSNKTAIHIEHNLEPCSFGVFCPTYKPDNDALYVLETSAGFAERHDIVEGAKVEFSLS